MQTKMLFCMKYTTQMIKKKKKKTAGKNVRISESDFLKIKKYTDEHNYKLGGFIANAAIEKIERDTIK